MFDLSLAVAIAVLLTKIVEVVHHLLDEIARRSKAKKGQGR